MGQKFTNFEFVLPPILLCHFDDMVVKHVGKELPVGQSRRLQEGDGSALWKLALALFDLDVDVDHFVFELGDPGFIFGGLARNPHYNNVTR